MDATSMLGSVNANWWYDRPPATLMLVGVNWLPDEGHWLYTFWERRRGWPDHERGDFMKLKPGYIAVEKAPRPIKGDQ